MGTVRPDSAEGNGIIAEVKGPAFVFEAKYASLIQMRNLLFSTLRSMAVRPERFSRARLKTVYFDDRAGTSYSESRDGEFFKKKYRFREYIGPEEGGAFYSLEVKVREDRRTRKVKRLICRRLPAGYRLTTFRALIDAFEDLTGSSLSDLRLELPEEELFAGTTVYYERARFDDRRRPVRYNLDTGIMVCPSTGHGTDRGCGFHLDHDVFEIKSVERDVFPGFLEGLGLEPVSFSKFVWGREVSSLTVA